MVTVKTKNLDKVIEKFSNFKDRFDTEHLNKIANKIANKVRDFIELTYTSTKIIWQEENGNLKEISGNDVKVINDSTRFFVTIGAETTPFEMPKRTEKSGQQYQGLPKFVNPYFFIEFGFGIIGANNSSKYANKFGWKYNIRPYSNRWHFKGLDGTRTESRGGKGANAIGKLATNFRQICEEVITEEMKQYA